MRLLLDTHTFIWFVEDNPKLSHDAKALIENGDNEVFLSAASLWEMAIKVNLGKLDLGLPFETFVPQQLAHNLVSLLDIRFSHIIPVATLPLHHRDPFDRLLISQSITEQMPIVSADTALDGYPITRLW